MNGITSMLAAIIVDNLLLNIFLKKDFPLLGTFILSAANCLALSAVATASNLLLIFGCFLKCLMILLNHPFFTSAAV